MKYIRGTWIAKGKYSRQICIQRSALFDLIEFIPPNYFRGKLGIEIEIFHFRYGRLIRFRSHRAVATKVTQFRKIPIFQVTTII